MGAGALIQDVEPENIERQRWLALAEKALAGASFEERLVSHSDDNIRIEPLYDRSTAAEPIVRANPKSPWIVSQRVDDPDTNRAKSQALEDVAQGATGLSLVFEGAPNAFGYGLPRTAEAVGA
ncbi:methylmalonyl-CoA mutase, partial [Mesorhizobium sp. M7A.F.Ca.CA.004.07.1.1]